MTYTIFAKGKLTRNHLKIADARLKSGLLEHAYDDTVSFHDLEKEDIEAAIELMNEFGFEVEPDIYEEHYKGSLCELIEVEWKGLMK